MTITKIAQVCAIGITIMCAYMVFIDGTNQFIWTIALAGWLPHIFADR